MPDVRVRGLDDEVISLLKANAKKRGLTLQADLRDLLMQVALEPRRKLFAELRAHQSRMREKYGVMPDSTPLIRQERDRIG